MTMSLTKFRKSMLMLGIVLFTFFLILSYFVAREYLVQFDFDTTVRLHDNIPARFDSFLSSFSLLGSFEFTGLIFLAIVLIGVFYNKRKIWRLFIFGFFPLFHVIEIIGKSFIDQSPPPFMFHRYAFNFHFPSSYLSTDLYSYPSGHSGRTAFVVGLIALAIWKSKQSTGFKYTAYIALGIFLFFMIVSRVTLGEHWTTDVIGGMLLGFSFAALSGVIW